MTLVHHLHALTKRSEQVGTYFILQIPAAGQATGSMYVAHISEDTGNS